MRLFPVRLDHLRDRNRGDGPLAIATTPDAMRRHARQLALCWPIWLIASAFQRNPI